MQIVNEFNKKEFLYIFGNIYEGSEWIAEKLFDLKPFNSFDDIKNKMRNIFEKTNHDNQIKVLLNHPDLADKAKIRLLTKQSHNEQKNSKLDQCTEKEYNEFKNLNNKYKKKFGFPFILAVSGKNKYEILNNFKKRILFSKDDEFLEAKNQVMIIANLRLNELKKNY